MLHFESIKSISSVDETLQDNMPLSESEEGRRIRVEENHNMRIEELEKLVRKCRLENYMMFRHLDEIKKALQITSQNTTKISSKAKTTKRKKRKTGAKWSPERRARFNQSIAANRVKREQLAMLNKAAEARESNNWPFLNWTMTSQ